MVRHYVTDMNFYIHIYIHIAVSLVQSFLLTFKSLPILMSMNRETYLLTRLGSYLHQHFDYSCIYLITCNIPEALSTSITRMRLES